jgi:hypothetical protein
MRTLLAGLVGLAVTTAATPQDTKDKASKGVRKVTADAIGKDFEEDAEAAKKKYAGEFQLTGTATLAIGSGKETEVLVENAAKIPIRLATEKRPLNFPAKFIATVKYKDFFAPAKELSLTASKMEYK